VQAAKANADTINKTKNFFINLIWKPKVNQRSAIIRATISILTFNYIDRNCNIFVSFGKNKSYMNYKIPAALLCTISFAIVAASCTRNGKSCPNGYEGASCATAWRTKFIGNWTQAGAASSSPESQKFTVSVQAGTAITDVSILNFDNTCTAPVTGYMFSANYLTIPSQVVSGQTITGYCYIPESSSTIEVHYSITNARGITTAITCTW
jgi:hypothetical protein